MKEHSTKNSKKSQYTRKKRRWKAKKIKRQTEYAFWKITGTCGLSRNNKRKAYLEFSLEKYLRMRGYYFLLVLYVCVSACRNTLFDIFDIKYSSDKKIDGLVKIWHCLNNGLQCFMKETPAITLMGLFTS